MLISYVFHLDKLVKEGKLAPKSFRSYALLRFGRIGSTDSNGHSAIQGLSYKRTAQLKKGVLSFLII